MTVTPCSPWNSPGQNTEMGNLSLLQGILPIQGSNPGLLHCRQMLYQLSHKGGPGKIKGKRKRGLQRVRWLDAITDSMDMKVKVKSLSHVRPFAIDGHSPWNSLGQNTGVGSLSLLQGILPIQGSNLGLLHCGQILYQLSHKGSPRILQWVT